MDRKLNLDVNDILNQQFSIDFKGYSPSEVDKFLDMIIQDYQLLEETISQYSEKMTLLERSNTSLKAHILELEGKQRVQNEQQGNSNYSQVDVLKRLARLEAYLLEKEEN